MSKQTTLSSFFKKKPAKPPAPAPDAAPAPAPAAPAKPGAELVGRRLRVWWPDDAAWYAGRVTAFDGARHSVAYDDGDAEAVDLGEEKFEVLAGAAAEAPPPPPPPPTASAGLTPEERARVERTRQAALRKSRAAAGFDDAGGESGSDFEMGDAASSSDSAEDDDVVMDDDDASDDDRPKPKPKRRRVVCDDADDDDGDADAAMKPAAPAPSRVSTARPGTPEGAARREPFDARAFHDRYRKRSAPVSVEKEARPAPAAGAVADAEPGQVESHDGSNKVLPAGCHEHDVEPAFACLTTERRDAKGRTPDDPAFDNRTMKIDLNRGKLAGLTATQQRWWEIKSKYADCILFYKIGKFYELYHVDADIGVAEAGLVYMKGYQAHSGFPELAYGKYVEALVSKGFKVARVEQTEKPDEVKIRVKAMTSSGRKPSKIEKGMRREVCSVTTPGTRLYTVLDMKLEKDGGGFEPIKGPTTLVAVTVEGSTVGACLCDCPTGTITLAEFDDDASFTRLRTLLAGRPPAEVLVQRGAKTLAEVCARATGAGVEFLETGREFRNAADAIKALDKSGAFPKASKTGATEDVARRWPPVLREAVRGNAGKALSALGAVAWWLARGLVDVELLSMRRFEAYVPPDLEEEDAPTFETFVPHDEARVVLAALDASARDEDDESKDDWRAALRRTAPRMALDATTLKNLEVLRSSHPDGWSGSLLHLLQNCKTAFGARLLRDWLARPLYDARDVDARADAVQELVDDPALYGALHAALKKKGIPDLDRSLQQLHTLGADRRAKSDDVAQHPDARAVLFDAHKFDARRVAQLATALEGLGRCRDVVGAAEAAPTSSLLKRCLGRTGDDLTRDGAGCFPDLTSQLAEFDGYELRKARDSGVLEARRGVDPEADAAADEVAAAEAALEAWLRETKRELRCGELKWKHTAKDRYCVEAPEQAFGRGGRLEQLPRGWSQRAKTKKARAFDVAAVRPLLEALVAREKTEKALKVDQMRRCFKAFDANRARWAAAVACVGTLDALVSLARASRAPGMCRATLLDEDAASIAIEGGAHPCLASPDVVENDLKLGGAAPKLLLLSGPNMGGKSTLLRQACVAAILAQAGCYVRAATCALAPVDRVFTRLGASDKILEGQSTFMVELLETAAILEHATPRSLVILDELGRGTATFDGAAIAHSVVDHLVREAKCRALFATHYHDLVRSWADHAAVQLGHMDCLVEDGGENVVFLYKLAEGMSPKSFGINVARLARLPKAVLERAAEKSAEFEARLTS